jgi:hypothetical protein
MATGITSLQAFFHSHSNSGVYARPNDDAGLTVWHPASLLLGRTLDACAARYRRYCLRYRPVAKPQRTFVWGGSFSQDSGCPNAESTGGRDRCTSD